MVLVEKSLKDIPRQNPPRLLLYNAARTYALAFVWPGADPNLKNVKGRELRRVYLREAVKRLTEVLESVPAAEREAFWKTRVLKEPAFQPFRPYPLFVEPAQKFGGPGKKPDPKKE